MIEKDSTYVHGSAAPKIKYDVYEENKVLKEKKKNRTNNKGKLKGLGLILIFFAVGLAVIFRYAVITELNYKVVKEQKAYEALRDENTRLKVEISKETNLDKIRTAAENRLGMQRPDKYQIVYVKVPKNDYTEAVDRKNMEKASPGNMFALVQEKVSKFAGLLY